MKKSTLIAAAVAAVISGSTFADTTMYGNVRLDVRNAEQLSMESGKMIVGFKASEDMGNGMTGFMHMELEHDRADEQSGGINGSWQNDLSYVGIKGDFGTLTLGAQNDAAAFGCQTDINTYNDGNACSVGAVNDQLDNAISYMNTFGDVTFVVGATLDGSQSVANDDTMNTIVGVLYNAGDFQIGGQVTSIDGTDGNGTTDPNWMVLGGSYTINDMTFALTVADNDANNDNTAYAVSAAFGNVAGGTIKVAVDTGDALDAAMGAAGDGTTTNVEYSKNLSKSVYTGVQYTSVDGADDDEVNAYLGMKF